MTKPMQPARLQPIGFWTARAGEAIRHRTRSRLGELGVSQPEWWVLHQLSLDDPAGRSIDTIVETIGPNESEQAAREAIAALIDKGWARRIAGNLEFGEEGRAVFERAAEVQRELDAERRESVSEDEYATAITVMQRTIRNVGGEAWHW